MAENTPTNTGAVDKNGANERLEQQKKEALGAVLDLAVKITRNDEKITGSVAMILDALAHEVAKNPTSFFSNGGSDIHALVTALKAKSESGPGVSGGDIVGGLSWSDIVDTIKALEGFLKDEKAFVMDILRLIFCGCSGKGW
jgi:hypothetical protein